MVSTWFWTTVSTMVLMTFTEPGQRTKSGVWHPAEWIEIKLLRIEHINII
jgi:hypothetical protein